MKKILLTCFALAFALYSIAQDRTISGKVTSSEDGSPLPGVNVVFKGTTNGGVTDIDGNYSLTVPQGSGILIFTFIGLQSQEVEIGTRTSIDVKMITDVQQLSEVVVTGLGIATDKRKIAISVESVNAEELSKSVASADLSQALVGKIPGAFIQSVSGQPGQQQNIMLRGINSINGAGTQPMIMIDGIMINTDNSENGSATNFSSRLADLDLANIERVEVVQGAAAATIYGAQGANGVIQIFTKKGKIGKMRVDVSSSINMTNYLKGNFEKATTHHFATTADGSLANSGGTALKQETATGQWPDPIGAVDGTTKSNKPYVNQTYNHADELFVDNARTFNNSITLSGGSEKVQYLISGSHLSQEGVINGKFKRTNLRLNLDTELAKNLKFASRTTLVTSDNTTGGITGADNVESALGSALNLYPHVDLKFKDNLGNYVANPTGDNSVNPYFTFDNRKYNAGVTRAIQNFEISYPVNKIFEPVVRYGVDYYRYDFRDYIKNQTEYNTSGVGAIDGSLLQRQDEGITQNFLGSLFAKVDFQRDFSSSLPINWTTQVAFDWRSRTLDRVTTKGVGVPTFTDNITMRQTSSAEVDGYYEKFVTYGYLVNTRFDYDGKVGISGGFRNDYSSAFGAGSDPFFFPRADAFVRISEFGFFEGLKDNITEFKIRAAYGEAGVQPEPFDRYPAYTALSVGQTATLTQKPDLTNPDLQVQVSKELEIGTDINFAVGKEGILPFIGLGFTYWDRTSEDVIRKLDVAPSTGSATFLDNSLTFESHGIQASLNAEVLQMNNFSWNLTTNFGRSVTEVTNISNHKDISLGNNFVIREGAVLGSFFGYSPLTSLDQTRSTGTRYIAAADEGGYEVGPYGYVVNKTTKAVAFADESKVLMGDPTPDFNMSFINDFTIFKKLTIGAQLDWVQGIDVYNQTKQWLYRDLVHGDISKPVTINGESAQWSNFYQSLYRTNNPVSHFVEDASFVRLRSLSISYDLSSLAKMRSLRLTFTGNNLFTITDYSGFDPEAAAGLNNAVERGVDQFAFPNFKSYGVKLDIGL